MFQPADNQQVHMIDTSYRMEKYPFILAMHRGSTNYSVILFDW